MITAKQAYGATKEIEKERVQSQSTSILAEIEKKIKDTVGKTKYYIEYLIGHDPLILQRVKETLVSKGFEVKEDPLDYEDACEVNLIISWNNPKDPKNV